MVRCCWITSANRWSRRSIALMRPAVWSNGCGQKATSPCMRSSPRRMRWNVLMNSTVECLGTCSTARFTCSARTEDHHGLAFDIHQVALLQILEHTSDHLPGAANDPSDFLTGHLDLHAIGMGHGIWLLAQFKQAAGDATGDVEKRQVTALAGGVVHALCALSA